MIRRNIELLEQRKKELETLKEEENIDNLKYEEINKEYNKVLKEIYRTEHHIKTKNKLKENIKEKEENIANDKKETIDRIAMTFLKIAFGSSLFSSLVLFLSIFFPILTLEIILNFLVIILGLSISVPLFEFFAYQIRTMEDKETLCTKPKELVDLQIAYYEKKKNRLMEQINTIKKNHDELLIKYESTSRLVTDKQLEITTLQERIYELVQNEGIEHSFLEVPEHEQQVNFKTKVKKISGEL